MSFPFRLIPAVMGLAWVTVGLAAEPGQLSTRGSESRATGLPGETPQGSGQPRPATPPLPGTKTAADTFRELLAMSPGERDRALADRTEHQRKYLEDRLREYEALPLQEREARLRQLDLKAHLTVLMKLAPTNRVERLKLVPADLLPVIEERLKEWDRLPANVRQEVLEYDTTTSYFLRVKAASPGQSIATLPGGLPPSPPGAAETSTAPEHVQRFLQLPRKEQQKTLETLPTPERAEMEKTLKAFANLPPEQRRICIASFEKLGRMSPEQRNEFLKNAARWQAMSPGERDTWRTLVNILPPTPSVPDNSGAPVTASNGTVVPGGGK